MSHFQVHDLDEDVFYDEGPISRAIPLVYGDRQSTYGHPSEDFARTAGMWKALFGWDVRPEDVPLAMVTVKLSRLRQTPDHQDSMTDVAGYIETYSLTRDAIHNRETKS